jgi:3-phenylpropionate/trans-cinnamate dioxygenase ferredoxin reductase component
MPSGRLRRRCKRGRARGRRAARVRRPRHRHRRSIPFIRSELPGVYLLRTLDDCLALREALRPPSSVTVVGAGWIGTEVAAACRQLDVDVTVVEALEAPVTRALGPVIGGWLAQLHRDRGTRVELGTRVTEVVADDKGVGAVKLSNGEELRTDALVVAIGAVPEVSWLVGSGLELDDGVVCDASCRAIGYQNIVAAGDVARWFNPVFGRTIRVEHWTNAAEQARAAAVSLLAHDRTAPSYAPVPYFWSDQYETKLQFVGIAGDYAGMAEGRLGDKKFVALFAERGRLVGALCVNAPARLRVYERFIAEAKAVSEVLTQ